jgi:hypothetical protein
MVRAETRFTLEAGREFNSPSPESWLPTPEFFSEGEKR